MEKFKRGLIFFMIEMLKTLGKSVREYKKTAIITPFLVTLEVIMEVIIPLLMAELIDKGIYAGNMNQVLKIGVLLVVTSLLSLAFGMLSGVTASKASAGFAKNLRKDLYYKIQNFSFTNIDKFSTSSIVTRLTTDVSNVQMAFQMITRIVVRTPLMLIFSLVMSFTINAELSLIFLGLIPVIGIVLYFIISRAHPIFEKVFQKYDSLNNVVEENTSGIRVVKSYLLEESEKKKFGKISNEIYMDFSKAQKLMSLTNPVMQFAMYSAIILISWLGAKIIVTTNMVELEVGQLTSLITYGIRLLTSLMMLTMLLVMSTMARNSAERIYEILIEELDLKNPKKPVKEIKDGSIEFDNVSFSYIGNKKKECLKNIKIKIKSGETVGIIGGIGSGKSTLVNLIPRLYDATEGTVKVGGKDVKKYDIEALRNEVSVVLQNNLYIVFPTSIGVPKLS